jgi:hypothetical protein
MFKSNAIGFSTFACHRRSSAVGSEHDASRKANQENASQALRRVTASFEIGRSDGKMSMTIQLIVLA